MALHVIFIDFNSYFASVEQQLVPALRGRPIAVVPVEAETTCCIAASYEAKRFGVKTGVRVADARRMCPGLRVVMARPERYVEFHHRLVEVVESCVHVEQVCSIDEMWGELTGKLRDRANAEDLARRIKRAIRDRVGAHLRSSIGIAPNAFLAKTATDMQKPDGLVIIDHADLPHCLHTLALRDLCGIGARTEARLKLHGIRTVKALCEADEPALRRAWGGVEGSRMHANLRGEPGWRIHEKHRSLGHSHVLAPELRNEAAALAVLHRLLQKAAMRLRAIDRVAARMHLAIRFTNRQGKWTGGLRFPATNDTIELTRHLGALWSQRPRAGAAPMMVGVSLHHLALARETTPDLFGGHSRDSLDAAIDTLNTRYGRSTVILGGALGARGAAPMRIAFTRIPDLATEGD